MEFLDSAYAVTVLFDKSNLLGNGKVVKEKYFQTFSYLDPASHPGTFQGQVLSKLEDYSKGTSLNTYSSSLTRTKQAVALGNMTQGRNLV